jgi:hypothetical protein
MRTLRHWWNGASGGSAEEHVRRDIYLRTDGRRWEVEATEGAAEAAGSATAGGFEAMSAARMRSTRRTYATEEEAQAVLREWLGDESEWQEVQE